MFTEEQIKEIRCLLDECTDEELYALFSGVFETIRAKLIEIKNGELGPYKFRSKFPDIE